MSKDIFETLSTDILVIGGGGAGLRAAIAGRQAGADVLVASKSRVGYGNNTYISKATFAVPASGGDPRDNPQVHVDDILKAGRYINDRQLASLVAREATQQIDFLEQCGVQFFCQEGKRHYRHLPGHSYARHVRGANHTGSDFMLPLLATARKMGVRMADHVLITRLFLDQGRFCGAAGMGGDGHFWIIEARCAILATGGFAQVFRCNNNAAGITGDGHVLAYQAGVPLMDMEFVQFYPTALGVSGNRLLLYEALVGDGGAVLRNVHGQDIAALHGMESPTQMTRDRLARSILQEILEERGVEGRVIMDLTSVPGDRAGSLRHLMPSGAFPESGQLLVTPTTHFCMGGVVIDPKGETQVPGLFAAGEICAGVHGANRLGGNALSEVFAMGGIVGAAAARKATDTFGGNISQEDVEAEVHRLKTMTRWSGASLREKRRQLKETLWQRGGILRNETGLSEALSWIENHGEPGENSEGCDPLRALEFQNMRLVSEMVCRSALARQESRGSHYRTDFPAENDDLWLKNILIRKGKGGMDLYVQEVRH